jgi:hypothetical protein
LAFVAHSELLSRMPLVLVSYPIAGLLGGMLAAVAFPLVRWVGGAFVVGAAAMLPLYLGVGLAVDGGAVRDHLATAAICAVCVGGLVGVRAWFDEHRRRYKLAHVWLFALICAAVAWFVGIRWAGQWPAVVAMFVFLLPVAVALFVTLDHRDASAANRAA